MDSTIGGAATATYDLSPTPAATSSPLTQSQRQLWYAEQLGGHPAGYLVPVLLRLEGDLDVAALRHALTEIVARHEVLRTSVDPAHELPLGVLRPSEMFTLSEAAMSEAALAAAGGLDQLVRNEMFTPLDVVNGLPIRARLIRLGPTSHLLCLAVHHIAFDDWSRRVLYTELSEFYHAFLDNRPADIAPLAIQYQEFAAEQERRTVATVEEQLKYWRMQLADLTAFELLPERPRLRRRAGVGASLRFTISGQLTERLVALGSAHGATLAMVLFAATQLVLRHYTGRDDVTFGTTVAERDRPGAETLIGPLINTLVLRGDTSGDPPFGVLIERTRELVLDAFEHSDVPFSRLVEELQPEPDLSRTPLYQIMVGYGGAASQPPQLRGLTVTELPAPDVGSKWDMNIWYDHRADGSIVCDLGWDASLYHRETMQRFGAHLHRILTVVAQRPESRLSEVQVLSTEEINLLRTFATGPVVEYPASSLHERFERQVARTPDAVAVVAPDGSISTYAELNARANRVADRLRRLGVGPEVFVGVCAERSLDLVTGLLGVLKAGGAYLPLDPAYPPERFGHMVTDAAAPIILAQDHLARILPAVDAKVLLLDDPTVWADCSTDNPVNTSHPDNAVYVIYTSGSTGQPKGVLVTHRAVVDRIEWMQRIHALGSDDAVLQIAPTTFDVSVSELFWPLAVGARLVLARPGGQKDTGYLRDLIIAQRVTMAQFVPSMLAVFLGEDGIEKCTSLRLVVPAGEELPIATATEFVTRLPWCELYNGYGPTEAAIYANWWHCRPEALAGLDAVPLGTPFGNTRTYVLDAELRQVPPGAVGELCIGGKGLARAYLNRPGYTAERFRPDPFHPEPGERLYRTGDLVRLRSDGRSLDFLGRIDRQVKVRGFRIELGEVEGALSACPTVEAAVALVRDVGISDRRLVGYVTPAAGATVDVSQLNEFLSRRLPPHAVPSEIVVLDTWPRLTSGKIDRQALLAFHGVDVVGDNHVAPRTPVEKAIAEIWSEVLGVPRVGIRDNFFAIGGHSLSGIRAVNRMREWFDIDMPLSLFFESPTIDALAAHIERAINAE